MSTAVISRAILRALAGPGRAVPVFRLDLYCIIIIIIKKVKIIVTLSIKNTAGALYTLGCRLHKA